MHVQIDPAFSRMDQLSLSGEPFFFMVDYLKEIIEVHTVEELPNSGLCIDFKGVKSPVVSCEFTNEIYWLPHPESLEKYAEGFYKVQKHLRAGDSYLVNYTRKTPVKTNLTLEEIYYRSKARYKLLYQDKFVMFSPETFVEIKGDRITTHPMKGTIDASLPYAVNKLKNSPKEKAEHYTVVDLLRNDLSLVADEVKVDDFQRVDLIRTQSKDLYAMSSEISGRLKKEFRGRIGSIMNLLLPAGSVTGAPKPKTVEIIREAEGYSRGWYTGVCGWFDGQNLDTCVIIRFVEQENNQLYFKSGGGITHMSELETEYEEMKNKIYVPVY